MATRGERGQLVTVAWERRHGHRASARGDTALIAEVWRSACQAYRAVEAPYRHRAANIKGHRDGGEPHGVAERAIITLYWSSEVCVSTIPLVHFHGGYSTDTHFARPIKRNYCSFCHAVRLPTVAVPLDVGCPMPIGRFNSSVRLTRTSPYLSNKSRVPSRARAVPVPALPSHRHQLASFAPRRHAAHVAHPGSFSRLSPWPSPHPPHVATHALHRAAFVVYTVPNNRPVSTGGVPHARRLTPAPHRRQPRRLACLLASPRHVVAHRTRNRRRAPSLPGRAPSHLPGYPKGRVPLP